MGYLKKFTDFAAALAAADGAVYLVRMYMTYRPGDAESSLDKLKLFLSDEAPLDYRTFFLLCMLLLFSALMGRILRRVPLLSLPIALYAFTFTVYLYDCDKLLDRPMLFLILGALHCLGYPAELLMRDRDDRKHRAFWSANLTALAVPAFCAYTLWRVKEVPAIPVEELKYFDSRINVALFLETDFSPFRTLIFLCVGCVLISLMLRNLYFLDLILSAVPFVYAVRLWLVEETSLFAPILTALLGLTVIVRLAVMLGEHPAKRKNAADAADVAEAAGELS